MQANADSVQFGVESDHAAHRQALAPVLLGLLAPMLLFMLIDPRALSSISVIAPVYLFAIFVIASAAYLISVFENGEVTRITFDRATKLVVVERTGMLAKSEMEIPFADIATVRMETRFDDDGYQTRTPILVLTTREAVELPAGTNETDVVKMRAMLRTG